MRSSDNYPNHLYFTRILHVHGGTGLASKTGMHFYSNDPSDDHDVREFFNLAVRGRPQYQTCMFSLNLDLAQAILDDGSRQALRCQVQTLLRKQTL